MTMDCLEKVQNIFGVRIDNDIPYIENLIVEKEKNQRFVKDEL